MWEIRGWALVKNTMIILAMIIAQYTKKLNPRSKNHVQKGTVTHSGKLRRFRKQLKYPTHLNKYGENLYQLAIRIAKQ